MSAYLREAARNVAGWEKIDRGFNSTKNFHINNRESSLVKLSEVKQDLKFLGIVRANPVEYVQRFGSSLKVSKDLPKFVIFYF